LCSYFTYSFGSTAGGSSAASSGCSPGGPSASGPLPLPVLSKIKKPSMANMRDNVTIITSMVLFASLLFFTGRPAALRVFGCFGRRAYPVLPGQLFVQHVRQPEAAPFRSLFHQFLVEHRFEYLPARILFHEAGLDDSRFHLPEKHVEHYSLEFLAGFLKLPVVLVPGSLFKPSREIVIGCAGRLVRRVPDEIPHGHAVDHVYIHLDPSA